jgi:hypothetical protein
MKRKRRGVITNTNELFAGCSARDLPSRRILDDLDRLEAERERRVTRCVGRFAP